MKYTKLLILFLIGLFINITNVEAETFIRKEVENKKVSISLNSNKGYAGALDATISLTGRVSFEKIEWDQSLKDLAMKECIYDSKNNSIRLLLVTKNNKQNLLDKDGILKIGIVSVKSNQTESYNLSLSKLSITNFDLEKTEIDDKELKSSGEKEFTIKIESKETPSSTNKNPDNKKPSESNTDKEKDENKEEDNEDSTIKNDKDDIKNDKSTSNKNEKKDNIKKYLPYIIIGIIIIVVVIIAILYYIFRKKQNSKKIELVENQIIEKKPSNDNLKEE